MVEITVKLKLHEDDYKALLNYANITKISIDEVISNKISPNPVNWNNDDDTE